MSPRRVGVDLTPLRVSKQYRRLYVAGFIAQLGGQATFVTVPFQLRNLTHSPLLVGTLGLVELVPIVLFGLYGGVLADRVDRRRMILATEVAAMVTILVLFANALAHHPQIWLIFVADTAIVATGSLQQPSIAALNQSLVPHDLQRAASTLATVKYTTAAIVGPAFGGLVAVAIGPAAAYLVNLVTFTGSLALLVTLRPDPRPAGAAKVSLGGGLRYARSRPDLMGTYTIDLLAMAWAYPVVMLPFVAARYHVTYALSVLYLGLPVGALVATLTSGWAHRVHHYGRAVVAAAALWGLGIALFGDATSLWWAFAGLMIGGGADAVSGIFRSTMWNESITPEVRGRMAGVELISYAVGPTAGQFRAGVMAAWTSLRFSLAVGGLGCTGSVAAAATGLRSMWRFDARTDPHVAEVRELRASETDSA
ncbi:MAG: MFS transporter [Acidimicrobiales bacterium]